MITEAMEREILLAESGEIDAGRLAALEAAVAASPEAQAYRARARRLTAAAAAQPADGPSEFVMARIVAEARAHRERRAWRFPLPAVRLAACAAALALVAGGVWVARDGRSAADTVGDLQTIVAMVSPHAYNPDAGAAAEQERLRELARHLLIMEGFVSEESPAEEAESQEPSPTTLRWRSTAEPPQEICG